MTALGMVALAVAGVLGWFFTRSRQDVTAVVTIFLLALFAINAQWVLPGAGAVGTPAAVVAVALAWWWTMARISRGVEIDSDPSPVRFALLFFLWFAVLSWGLARLRSLTEIEVNGSNTVMIIFVGLVGIALLITDGVTSRDRLETLLQRVAIAGAAFSVVGILQFTLRFDLVAIVRYPGLVINNDAVQTLATRSGFARAEGTGLHSIEFGVVLGMILPIALYFYRNAPTPRIRRQFLVVAGLVGAGIPLSVSRSGILAAAIALVVTSLAWKWSDRVIGAVTAGMTMIAMGIVVPGLIGTFRSIIFDIENDTSINARLERIPRVEEQVAQSPWIGEGIGTWSPVEDFLLDNQFFGTIIEMGLVGLTAVMAMLFTVMAVGIRVFRSSSNTSTRELAMALIAGVLVLPVSMATFDAFFYRIFMGVAFVFIGSIGALWRLEVRDAIEPDRVPDPVS